MFAFWVRKIKRKKKGTWTAIAFGGLRGLANRSVALVIVLTLYFPFRPYVRSSAFVHWFSTVSGKVIDYYGNNTTSFYLSPSHQKWEMPMDRELSREYRDFEDLIVQMIRLSYVVPPGYHHIHGTENDTVHSLAVGDAGWTRFQAVEVLSDSGLSAIITRRAVTKQVVIAYRGPCADHADLRCKQDRCALWHISGGESVSIWRGMSGLIETAYCRYSFGWKSLDYLSSAIEVAKKTRERLPFDHSLLLTGHSLGALLAATTAAKLGLQAVTLSLPRVDFAFWAAGVMDWEAPIGDVWTLYHPFDPIYLEAVEARPQGLPRVGTCVYLSAPAPDRCAQCMSEHPASSCKKKCIGVHFFRHYVDMLTGEGEWRPKAQCEPASSDD